MHICKMRRRY